MKFTFSTLLALAAVLPAVAAVPLKIPMVLGIVTDWKDGYVTVDNGDAIEISTLPNPLTLPIEVNGEMKYYTHVTDLFFDEVDENIKKHVTTSRVIDGVAGTPQVSLDFREPQPYLLIPKFTVAVVNDPGVKYVHIILDGAYSSRVNVYQDAVKLVTGTV